MTAMENEPKDPEWEKLSRIFLQPTQPPSAAQTEAFVCRVMARLEPQTPVGNALRWLTPALGFALAVSMVLALRPAPNANDLSSILSRSNDPVSVLALEE